MYNKNFRGNGAGPGRPKKSFGGRPRRRAFTGDNINIEKFINKAPAILSAETSAPQTSFAELQINPQLKKIIAERGYQHPTPIQEKAIPHILEGKDVIGLANTGTGKTGAFLIPMIHKILGNPQEKLLVVVPTRELAIQIREEFVTLTKGLRINSVVVVGGANIHSQINALRSRHNVVIGTPGRLKDIIQRKHLNLGAFQNVVLDEADRMLDMGFINDIKFLLSLTPPVRQTLFFSATLSSEIESLIQNFLKNPVKISIKTRDTAASVDQDVVRVKKDENKFEVLCHLLAQAHFQKILIFSRTKHGAEKLAKNLLHQGFKAESIHGDKSHNKRQRALKLFKENIVEILVATDVAARGLDIPNVSHVINFDIPATYEDYIHRIGRTGRADKKGSALTFVE